MIKPAVMRPETARLLGAALCLPAGTSDDTVRLNAAAFIEKRPTDIIVLGTDNSIWLWPVDHSLRWGSRRC